MHRITSLSLALAAMTCSLVMADDWTNLGGNAGANGLSSEVGPDTAVQLWSQGPSSIISWAPFLEGDRVFNVRQNNFVPTNTPNDAPIVAYDRNTGAELWRYNIPYVSGDWTPWIAGVKNGRVYASRSGNGASVSQVLYCIDAATGVKIWTSVDKTAAGAYDGAVFASNGDPIIFDFTTVYRINAVDGTTVWKTPRVGSVSGDCGGALFGNAIYIADAVVGGHSIKHIDATSGAILYQSPVMPGFTLQNTPFVGPDGTVYLARTQNNPSVDFFYAFQDTGSALVQKWAQPAAPSYASTFAADMTSVFMVAPDLSVEHRSATDGALIDSSSPISADFLQPHMALDAGGKLYYSNGAFSDGTLICFNPDLTENWSIPFPSANQGGPALGTGGTLVIATTSTVQAYQTAPAGCLGDLNGDRIVDLTDLTILLAHYGMQGAGAGDGDLNGDTVVDLTDLALQLTVYGQVCP